MTGAITSRRGVQGRAAHRRPGMARCAYRHVNDLVNHFSPVVVRDTSSPCLRFTPITHFIRTINEPRKDARKKIPGGGGCVGAIGLADNGTSVKIVDSVHRRADMPGPSSNCEACWGSEKTPTIVDRICLRYCGDRNVDASDESRRNRGACAVVTLALRWAWTQNAWFEPYTVLCGCMFIGLDLYRRFGSEKNGE